MHLSLLCFFFFLKNNKSISRYKNTLQRDAVTLSPEQEDFHSSLTGISCFFFFYLNKLSTHYNDVVYIMVTNKKFLHIVSTSWTIIRDILFIHSTSETDIRYVSLDNSLRSKNIVIWIWFYFFHHLLFLLLDICPNRTMNFFFFFRFWRYLLT